MLRCIAVDDETLALDLIEDSINQLPFLKMEGRFTHPVKALEYLQKETIDLVFLDIQMPQLSGLKLIQSLVSPPMFILVTAYEKFALEGYSLNVVDYLVKPVSIDRFNQACQKAYELYCLKSNRRMHFSDEPEYFFVRIDYSQVKVYFNEIIWIEGLRDYVKIYIDKRTRPLIVRASIKSLEKQLPANKFLRIHKSYIVSVRFVTAIRKNSVFLGERQLTVGDSFKAVLGKFPGMQVD